MRMFFLNVNWPDVVTNEKIYETSKLGRWNEIFKEQRLKWFHKLNRMTEETPTMENEMKNAPEIYKRSQGRPSSKSTFSCPRQNVYLVCYPQTSHKCFQSLY